MTVADNTSRNQYTATSGQTVFAYTFEIVDKDHIVVLQNGTALSEGTDYTVSNVGNDNGGNVTLTSGATAGDVMTLYRDMPYSRTQNYTNSGDFLASEVNADFDELWLAGEQTDRSFSQSIRKPITDSDSISMELPEAAARANKFVKFDATGAVDVAGATVTVSAEDVIIDDAGNYYTSNDVEGALQEVGASLNTKLENVVEDTTPQLGGNLDLNSNDITGTGNVNITGNVALSGTVDGRDVAADGTKLDGIAAGAEVNAVDSVNTQTGAVVLDADDIDDSTTTHKFTTASDISKLAGIEAGADVTDTANVTAAGAVMDSELTSEASVKALNQGVATTDSPTFAGLDVGAVSYAATDGTDGQVLTTDGSGSATFEDLPAGTYLNVKDFGATGDGTTDDTNAIQDAINYASHNTEADGGGKHNQTIFFPDGHYKYTVLRTYYDPTDNPDYSQDISDGRLIFRGTGRLAITDLESYDGTSTGSNNSADKRLTGAVLESTGAGLIVDPTNQQGPAGGNYGNARNFVAKDITFIADNTGQIIEAKSCPGLTFDHCSFLQLGTGSGIVARNCWFFTFNQCFLVGQSAGDGISSEFLDGPVVESGDFAGLWTVKSSMIEGFDNGIHWTGGKVSNFAVKDSAIQDSATYGIYADDSVNTNSQIQQMTLDNVYFEAITATPASFIKSSNDSIDQLYMQSCFMLGGGNNSGVATARITGAHIDLGQPSTVDIHNTRVFRPPTTFLHIEALQTGQKTVGTVSNTSFIHDATDFTNYTTPIYLVTKGSTAALPKLENNIVSGLGGIHEAQKTFQLYESSDEKIPSSIDPVTGATVSPRLSIGAQGKRNVGATTYLAVTEETYTEYVTTTSGAKVFLANDGKTPEGRLLVVKNSNDSTQNISFRNQPAFESSEIVSVTPGSTAFLVFTKDTEQFTGTGNQTYTYTFDSPSDDDLLFVYINGELEPFASSTSSDPLGEATYTVNLTNKTITFDSGAEPASGDKVVIAQYSYKLIGVFSESAGSAGDITGVTAGTGLTGGGTSGSVTLNVSDLTVSELAADSLQTSSESFSDSDTALMTAAAINDRIESFGYTTNTGDITGVTAGTGLTGGGASGAVTLNVNTGAVANGATTIPTGDQVYDFVIAQGYTSNTGDITGVTAGTGLTGGGASGSVTLNVNTGAVSNGAATIPTGDQVYDFVIAQGYTTNTGDITGVTAGDGLSGGATSGNATLAVDSTVARTTGDTFTGSVTFDDVVRLTETTDASLTSTGHAFQIGPSSGVNIAADNNEIMARDNGAASLLLLNKDGGAVSVNNVEITGTKIGQWNTAYSWGDHSTAGYTSNVGDITNVTAGTGLTGGGASGSVTLNVNTGAVANGATTIPTGDQVYDFVIAQGYTSNTGDITNVTAGTGLSGGGASGSVTLNVDLSELTDMTATMVGTDEFIVLDAGADRRKAANEIGLSVFNNDSGFTSNVGDITAVTAGTSLSGGGTSGSVTLNVATPTDAPASWNDVVAWNSALIKDAAVEIHGSGYLRATYLNMTHSVGTRNSDTVFYSSTDDFIRKTNATGMRSSLNVPTRTGGDASGTWGINITGSAATLDGIDSSQFLRSDVSDYVAAGRKITFNSNAAINTTSGDQASLEVYQATSGADAFMQFHVGSDYAVYFGLDGGTNDLAVGGWSMGANSYKVWHQGNDGSGSGLDADTLDGQHGSYYYPASNPNGYTSNSGDITAVTAGTGLSGGGSSGSVTLNVDLSELTDMTAAMVGTDEFIVLDAGADRRKAANEIPLSIFNNDSGFTSNAGDITAVTAGNGLSGGGTSGSVTLNVGAGSGISVAANTVAVDSTVCRTNSQIEMAAALDMNNNPIYGVDAIYHHGDTNTYMNFVSSDTWRVVTAGVEALRINSNRAALFHTTNEDPVGINDSGASILNNGRIKLHCTSGNDPLVVGTNTNSTGVSFWYHNGSSASKRGNILITSGGVSYNNLSDERAKENIVDAPSASNDIDAIRIRSFNYKGDDTHIKYGVIAQELNTVAPEVVHIPDDPEEMAGVDYSKLVPMLVKEIQSLRKRVAQLEGEI